MAGQLALAGHPVPGKGLDALIASRQHGRFAGVSDDPVDCRRKEKKGMEMEKKEFIYSLWEESEVRYG